MFTTAVNPGFVPDDQARDPSVALTDRGVSVATTRAVESANGTDLRLPRSVRLKRHLHELVSSRELLVNLTLRELRSRYKRSVLGWSWSLINPLSNVIIYSIVFSLILKVKPPLGDPSGLKSFPLFLLCGLIPWLFFSNGLMLTTESLLSNGNLIKKVYFPRELLVVAGVGSLVITNLIEMSVLSVILLLVGNMVLWWLPLVLVLIFLESVIILGIGLMLSALGRLLPRLPVPDHDPVELPLLLDPDRLPGQLRAGSRAHPRHGPPGAPDLRAEPLDPADRRLPEPALRQPVPDPRQLGHHHDRRGRLPRHRMVHLRPGCNVASPRRSKPVDAAIRIEEVWEACSGCTTSATTR